MNPYKRLSAAMKAGSIFIAFFSIVLLSLVWFVLLIEMCLAAVLAWLLFFYPLRKKESIPYLDGLVSIIIVNWNSKDYIVECLRCISAQSYPAIELIVVDNGSSDGSLEMIREYSIRNKLKAKVVENGKNAGFSRANNQAVRLAMGEYILTLNFDVNLDERFVENMVSGMKDDERIGMASGKIFAGTNVNSAGVFDTTGVQLRNLFCNDRGQGEADQGQFDLKEYIFGASGCASFFRRKMLEDVRLNGEYFDETFNTYVEDVDLSWRGQIMGWSCLYNPLARAFHHRGVTRKGDDRASRRIFRNYFIRGFRNRYLMILKDLSFATLFRKFPYIMWGEFKFWSSVFVTKRYFYAFFIPGFILLSPVIAAKRIAVGRAARRTGLDVESLLHWVL